MKIDDSVKNCSEKDYDILVKYYECFHLSFCQGKISNKPLQKLSINMKCGSNSEVLISNEGDISS